MKLREMSRIDWVGRACKEPILDVGCGDSTYFDESVDFVGLDKEMDSEDMLDGRPQEFVEGDAHDLPFPDNDFATVLLAEVLEHVDNPVQVLSEAYRVAGDRVVITVPHEQRWLPEAEPGEHPEHKRQYTGRQLMNHCLEAGIPERRVKIDHLNDFPFVFWVATINVVPEEVVN